MIYNKLRVYVFSQIVNNVLVVKIKRWVLKKLMYFKQFMGSLKL